MLLLRIHVINSSLQTLVGTTQMKRTTIPLMYNMNGGVKKLDVIDFPGVDDQDETIPELSKLLVGLAQIIIFVVDYRQVVLCCTSYQPSTYCNVGKSILNHQGAGLLNWSQKKKQFLFLYVSPMLIDSMLRLWRRKITLKISQNFANVI